MGIALVHELTHSPASLENFDRNTQYPPNANTYQASILQDLIENGIPADEIPAYLNDVKFSQEFNSFTGLSNGTDVLSVAVAKATAGLDNGTDAWTAAAKAAIADFVATGPLAINGPTYAQFKMFAWVQAHNLLPDALIPDKENPKGYTFSFDNEGNARVQSAADPTIDTGWFNKNGAVDNPSGIVARVLSAGDPDAVLNPALLAKATEDLGGVSQKLGQLAEGAGYVGLAAGALVTAAEVWSALESGDYEKAADAAGHFGTGIMYGLVGGSVVGASAEALAGWILGAALASNPYTGVCVAAASALAAIEAGNLGPTTWDQVIKPLFEDIVQTAIDIAGLRTAS